MARGDGGGRDGRGEPEWRPVTDVDMMTAIVLEQLSANRDQLRTLEPATMPLDEGHVLVVEKEDLFHLGPGGRTVITAVLRRF
ncbi:hypothetical protein [Nonomuraea sp. NPDC005501]|uniref:hypothetical protein n=1 Tax=Nonomuraea sp. NPDC005501 TaxID=3156884 RepID=UPI0033A28B96